MINQKLEVKRKGHVIISIWEYLNTPKVVYDDHNAILDNSKKIIAQCIGGDTTHKIDLIKAYKGGILVAQAVPTITYPFSGEVSFLSIFNTASFNDTIDEVRLSSNIGGDFSQIIGISVTKNDLQNMSVNWKIEII